MNNSKMGNFKISAPFITIENIKALKDAGANELYCGYIDKESERLWPISFVTINRRGKGQSFEDFAVFRKAIEIAYHYDLAVYVTMNGLYTKEQYPWLLKTIDKISKLNGIRGLIISDIGLLLTLKKIGYQKELVISTGGTTFNYYTADFFASVGARRVILDRQLSIQEMLDLISRKKTHLGIEIFIIGDPCFFIDGYCTFAHYLNNWLNFTKIRDNISLIKSYNTCLQPYGCAEFKNLLATRNFKLCNISGRRRNISSFHYQPKKYALNCNLCALYELKNFPDITLKVTGRGTDPTKAVEMVSRAAGLVKQKNITPRQYYKEAKLLYRHFYGIKCNNANCYYPQSLIKQG